MAKRIAKLQRFLQERQIDALLIKSKTMKKYMDTLTGSGVQVLLMKEHGYLILDGRYLTEAQEREHDLEIVLHAPHKSGRNYLGSVEELLKKHGCQSMGVESSQMLIKEYRQVEALGVKIHLLEDELAMLRIRKEEEEISIMKEAIALTDDIYEQVVSRLRIGMSEYEISALLHYFSIKAGAQQMAFDTIVASGERTAMPHGRPSGHKIRAHEPIMMDFGIQYKNYQSDMTRVVFFGRPKPEIETIYHVVLQAQLAGIAAIKKGALASDVDKAARDVITRHGYGAYFDHGLGHGLGIGDGCELPMLNQKGSIVLDEGMMMSCEPGVYVPKLGGIRIEDDVLIQDGIGLPLNKTAKTLRILKEEKSYEL